jgi:nitrogen fixation protein NifB
MRIAVPTNDGTNISEHFGRSAAFLVFEIENGRIGSRQMRPNAACHSHEKGACGESGGSHGSHSHAGILAALEGCQTVICAGMGQRAAEALQSAGITPVLAAAQGSAEAAVAAYLRGERAALSEGFCRCSH